jgi:hypothetical protein
MKERDALEFIHNHEEINNYYMLINRVMQRKSQSAYKNVLIKQEDWVAVCAAEELRDYSAILRTIEQHGYTELRSVSWDMLEPIVMKIQGTAQGLDDFRNCSVGWTILFVGKPDWMILFPHPEDFLLVAGKADMVEQLLGCTIEEAFNSIDEMIAESQFLSDEGRLYMTSLLYQLREVYSTASVGTSVDFDFG